MSVFQCDRLAADMAVELKRSGVASVSLWPGAVPTELVSQMLNTEKGEAVDPKVFRLPLQAFSTT
jgi:dehydrogenase/reductase SDR family protein 1